MGNFKRLAIDMELSGEEIVCDLLVRNSLVGSSTQAQLNIAFPVDFSVTLPNSILIFL